MAELLIQNGADVNAHDTAGSTPLDEAAWKGHADIAKLLIEHGAQVNIHNKENGATPLHEAAAKGHLEVVQVLLASGADPAARDNSTATALDEALRYRHSAVVSLLMDKSGASSGEVGPKQLQDAVMRGQSDMVALLLKKGADPNQPSAGGARCFTMPR